MNTLVFLHGWGATGNIWRRQVEAFSGLGFVVVTPTFPRWEIAWLAGCLKELSLADTIIVGWSLGGMLLLETLAKEHLKPAGLVLVATPASFCQSPGHPFGQPSSVVRALRRTIRLDSYQGLADFASRCLAEGETNFQEELWQNLRPRANGADLATGLDYLLNTDLRPQLSGVQTRTLIIQGDQDNIVTPAQTEFLRQHLQEVQVVRFPGAGHVPFLTQADEFNKVLKEFLRDGPGDMGLSPLPQT